MWRCLGTFSTVFSIEVNHVLIAKETQYFKINEDISSGQQSILMKRLCENNNYSSPSAGSNYPLNITLLGWIFVLCRIMIYQVLFIVYFLFFLVVFLFTKELKNILCHRYLFFFFILVIFRFIFWNNKFSDNGYIDNFFHIFLFLCFFNVLCSFSLVYIVTILVVDSTAAL